MYYIIGKKKKWGMTTPIYKYDIAWKQKHLDTALNKSEAKRLVKKHQKKLGDEWVITHKRVSGMQIL